MSDVLDREKSPVDQKSINLWMLSCAIYLNSILIHLERQVGKVHPKHILETALPIEKEMIGQLKVGVERLNWIVPFPWIALSSEILGMIDAAYAEDQLHMPLFLDELSKRKEAFENHFRKTKGNEVFQEGQKETIALTKAFLNDSGKFREREQRRTIPLYNRKRLIC